MTTTQSSREARQIATLEKIYDITDPWISATIEREPFTVLLEGGREVTIHCPLGAAVEIEAAGYMIHAGYRY